MEEQGAVLSRRYYDDVVAPALARRWPDLPHAAGRLGGGSDVLGLDDEVSQDHDWGLRLDLLVEVDLVGEVDAHLEQALPDELAGHRVRFATTWDARVRHQVRVDTVEAFVRSRTGLAASGPASVADWLSLTGQSVLEVTAGPVFADTTGALTVARDRLAWYPDDVWRHVVATDWVRLAQELPFLGRTGERDDDLGSRVITARLAGVTMHLAHLLERRWPPYAKWLGTSLRRLPRGAVVAEPLARALAADDWRAREEGLVAALRALNEVQREAGLPVADDPVGPFWDRRYRSVRDEVVTCLEDSVVDPEVRALPRGVGSAEQRSDNVDVLVHPGRRRGRP